MIKDIDTQTSTTPWRVFKEVNAQNERNRATYTNKQRDAASKLEGYLKHAYHGKIYVNYRDNFIAIKVERARTKDKFHRILVEAVVKDNGYEVRRSDQGIIFRIPRK